MAASTPIVRRLRAALFQLRAVVVFVALAIGIIAWMLVGIVSAAVASLLRPLFSRRRRADRAGESDSFPPDSSSPPTRFGAMPPWLRA